jgi:hypothetical protein
MSGHNLLTEDYHLVMGLSPVADAFADDTVRSDIVNMKNFHTFGGIVFWGVGTTGTLTITVEACSDTSATATTAIPFKYRVITGLINAVDTHGTLTQATATGVLTTAGSHQMVVVEVSAEELGDTGYSYARIAIEETVDSPLLGGIILFQGRPRYDTTTSTLT